MNSKKPVISSYLAEDEVTQSLYDVASHDAIDENSEYPPATTMGDVFMCSNKHTDTLNPVNVDLNTYPEMDILGVSSKRKMRRSIDIPPFPDDLRHFRYLPVQTIDCVMIQVIRIALKMHGLNQYVRQTNTLKLLKILGEYELSKTTFSDVRLVMDCESGQRWRNHVFSRSVPSRSFTMWDHRRAKSVNSVYFSEFRTEFQTS